MIRRPGGTAGERTQPVHTADLCWTLLAAAGLSADEKPVDGIDLGPILADSAAKPPRDALYWHYPHYYETTTPVSAVRAGDWKLLEYFEDGRRELYNLRDDPTESHNLAADQPIKTAGLQRQLAGWRESVGAKLPQPNPRYRGK
jgi:arylsulfatase A-like enzyme